MEEENYSSNNYKPLPSGKTYHVFLSYRDDENGDRQWVRELKEDLEKRYGLKCCNHVDDFHFGLSIVENIKEAVTTSVKTLIILTKEYKESFWCSYEIEYTHQLSMERRERIIIPVLKDDCEIPDHLKPFTYIDARGPRNQWLAKLVSAVGDPVNCAVDSKYAKIDHNASHRNFDIVHVEKTKFSLPWSNDNLPFKPRRYIPDALSDKVFNLTYDKYKNILKEVASTHLIKYRHTCQPWIPSLCFCTLPFLLVCLVFFVFAIKEFVFQSGDHAALVQQILKEEQNDQFFYLRPRKEHITVSKIEQNLDDRLKGAYFLLILTSIGIIFVVLWLLACGVKGTCLKKQLIRNDLKSTHRLLIDHNLLAGLRFHYFTGTVEVVFIYFNYLPCLESLAEYLSEKIDVSRTTKSGEIGGDQNKRNPQIVDSGQFLENTEIKPEMLNQDDVCILQRDENSDLKKIAKRYFYEMAPDFVWDFLAEELEHTELSIHSTRMKCLCEYVKARDLALRGKLCSPTGYNNFDIVHEEETKFRWFGCRKELPFKTRYTLPDALSDRIFNLTIDKYKDILNVIASTHLIKHRHTCQPWIATLCFCAFPFLSIFIFLSTIFIQQYIALSGNHTAMAQKIMEDKEEIYRNFTVAKIEDDLTKKQGDYYRSAIFFGGWILTIVLWLLTCIVNGTCLKKRSVRRKLMRANQMLIHHNLLAGLKLNPFTGTAKVVFIYFEYKQCLNGLADYLEERSRLYNDFKRRRVKKSRTQHADNVAEIGIEFNISESDNTQTVDSVTRESDKHNVDNSALGIDTSESNQDIDNITRSGDGHEAGNEDKSDGTHHVDNVARRCKDKLEADNITRTRDECKADNGGKSDDIPMLSMVDTDDIQHIVEDDDQPLITDEGPEYNVPAGNGSTEYHSHDEDFTAIARYRLCQMSTYFMWDLLAGKLETTEASTHSSRIVCLCDYIKTYNTCQKRKRKMSGNILSYLIRCCPFRNPQYSKLMDSSRLTENDDNEIIIV